MVPVGRAYRAARSRTSASREACNSEGSKAFCSARRAPTTCPASDPRSRMACLMVGYLPRDKQRRGLSREMKGAVMPGSEAAPPKGLQEGGAHLDAALSGRLRRGRCACPSPPLASRAHRGLWASGRTAGRYASAARAFISPTAFEQARGGALGAGGGRVGFAEAGSSELF